MARLRSSVDRVVMTQHPQLDVRLDETFLSRIDNWRRDRVDLPKSSGSVVSGPLVLGVVSAASVKEGGMAS